MNTRDAVVIAEQVATGKRWCSACQSTKPIQGGKLSPRMWRCQVCEATRQKILAEKRKAA